MFLVATWLAIGCRSPLTPNIDRNKAPETWITAAPQDTITFRGPDGTPVQIPPSTIAVRFHLYWAGSDEDGEVAGFYYAVVETLPLPPPGLSTIPPLPGPRAKDYRFTTRTDSTFIFTVSESSPDRQHAFFIYAVDNLGKADPTPARVIFNALDRFPPVPVIESALGLGQIYRWRGVLPVAPLDTTVVIRDSLTFRNIGQPPKETIPLDSRVEFRWRAEPRIAGTVVSGFRYKLDEPDFIAVPGDCTRVVYPAGSVTKGTKVITLRAVDEAGGAGETNRYFQVNYQPRTWFSGPDVAQYPLDPVTGERFVSVPDWRSPPAFPASLFGCDSVTKLPAARPERKTFFEIFDPDGAGPLPSRVYVRSENDTVHRNSWIVLHTGGSDLDSPYEVQVDPNYRPMPDSSRCTDPLYVMWRTGRPNGSPIGFHQQYTTFLTPSGPTTVASQSGLYPIFDGTSVFLAPRIGGYQPMLQAGKVYAVVRAEDGNGERDRRIGNAKDLADRVDRGQGTPEEIELRRHVLTFYVDKAPALQFSAGSFSPRPNQRFFTRRLDFNLLAHDRDPFDRERPPDRPGGPSVSMPLRRRVQVMGRNAAGSNVTFPARADSVFSPSVTIDLTQSTIVDTAVTVLVELCDCPECESRPGSGRCVDYRIPIKVPAPSSVGAAAQEPPFGPGDANARRSEAP